MALTGGAALQRKLAEISKKVQSANTLRVGFLEGATYPDGTPVAQVAAVNEFGAPERDQPPRPFFRNMIAEKQAGWGDALAKTLKATDYDAAQAFGQIGEGMKGQLQKSIQQLDTPALAPSTVARKGFDKPLVDTGHMQNSVDYEVQK